MRVQATCTRTFLLASLCLPCVFTLLGAGRGAAESPGQPGAVASIRHLEVTGVIAKIHPAMFFIRLAHGSQPRTLSMLKAERIGLHEARIGDSVTLLVDEGNVLVDAYRAGATVPDHRVIAGELQYTDQTWEEIKLSTPEGIERYEVDPLAGSKLSGLNQGSRVEVELDADNQVVYILRAR